jgi:hypothetical protein
MASAICSDNWRCTAVPLLVFFAFWEKIAVENCRNSGLALVYLVKAAVEVGLGGDTLA